MPFPLLSLVRGVSAGPPGEQDVVPAVGGTLHWYITTDEKNLVQLHANNIQFWKRGFKECVCMYVHIRIYIFYLYVSF